MRIRASIPDCAKKLELESVRWSTLEFYWIKSRQEFSGRGLIAAGYWWKWATEWKKRRLGQWSVRPVISRKFVIISIHQKQEIHLLIAREISSGDFFWEKLINLLKVLITFYFTRSIINRQFLLALIYLSPVIRTWYWISCYSSWLFSTISSPLGYVSKLLISNS